MALAKVQGLDLSYLDNFGFKNDLISDENTPKNHSLILPSHSDQTQNSFINWKQHNNSVLSFEEKFGFGDNCVNWIDPIYHDYQMNYQYDLELDSSEYSLVDNQNGQNRFKILYSSVNSGEDFEGISKKEQSLQKRQLLGGDMQPSKRHFSNSKKESKTKITAASKDPQSIAAKIRRERISERLKILQDLVPNGTKVDLVTMLEKAISYVKFLQLQVKVLATDEFWPAQGGKAPEISHVKEAIDAILSCHRERNSTYKL